MISIDHKFHILSKTGKISGKYHLTNYLEPKKDILILNKFLDRIRPPWPPLHMALVTLHQSSLYLMKTSVVIMFIRFWWKPLLLLCLSDFDENLCWYYVYQIFIQKTTKYYVIRNLMITSAEQGLLENILVWTQIHNFRVVFCHICWTHFLSVVDTKNNIYISFAELQRTRWNFIHLIHFIHLEFFFWSCL